MTNLQMLLDGLGAAPACLVTVESTQGSVPREPGAWMAVFADQLVGTIGGGHLELQAIAEARRVASRLPAMTRSRKVAG